MEQNLKPFTKQLLIATIILILVTAMSFGIRHVRISAYRADIVEHTTPAHPSDIDDQTQPKQPLYANTELDYYPKDSYIADTESDPQGIEESFWDEQPPSENYYEELADTIKYYKDAIKSESFKADYAKSVEKKALKKISLSDYEDLYISEKSEAWYVSKGPGGDVTKMQVQIDDYTDELIAVGVGFYAKQEPYRIPMSDNEDIYLTDEGEVWYVSEQPDGDTLKMQVQID